MAAPTSARVRCGLMLCWGVTACFSAGCQPSVEARLATGVAVAPAPTDVAPTDVAPTDPTVLRRQIDAFCGNCHGSSPANALPKDAWPMEIRQAYAFYYESARQDLELPPQDDVIAYFQSLAPAVLDAPPSTPAIPSPFGFERSTSGSPEIEPPAVSFLTWRSLRHGGEPRLLFSDMRSGDLRVTSPARGEPAGSELLSACAHPAHLEPCDLDGDRNQEFIVAELGSAFSGDHSRGAVIWLRPAGEGWKQRLLLSGVGRVADVRPGDFDGDGDSDLVVAEFGHFRTGQIRLLENTSLTHGIPVFREHPLDERSGTIHVPTADLNGDGRLDIVALISQEFEVVEAYLNEGDWKFRRERIFSANDPAYGSSGIQLVDLDDDADLDVLYTNGDTFGSEHIRPYHGIHWLENRGQYPYQDHRLAEMAGVQKALACDLDGDRDLDVVAVGLMPKNLVASPLLKDRDSVLWLEQTSRGAFAHHTVEKGQFYHAALEAADFDGDGDVDLAVGNMHPEDDAIHPWLTFWWNRRREER